ncbi:substrate-binding periplasmic protein [Aliiglaciecola lipolytica]|uniref:Solute-binding protein family 3/N-terminal domain-containing protein n=1 Tax=Aliiglaciecola lipolytica E3 TaxID=1127673 RepID=K6YDY2_9ALTE|nr:transporter substrate-binding domain-containing protein [Aliiglaciecola lipolytica]GAC16362.1 hypothetical protein GLIP_3751 [Aliiglaciecola lipolytica E3]
MSNKLYFILLYYIANLFVVNETLAKDVIDFAVGWDKPPYVMDRAKSGFEVELIEDVVERMGYKANFVQIPYGRSYEIHNMPDIDAVTTLSSKLESKKISLSNVYIQYQNVAVTLASSDLVLDEVSDLSQLSIVAFQSAHRVLGEDFSKMASANRAYREVPDQTRQLKLLFSQKTQVIIMDVNIFAHIKKALEKNADEQQVVIHQLFTPNLYRAGFINHKLQMEFDNVLPAYLTSKDYQQLVQKYQFYNAVVAN